MPLLVHTKIVLYNFHLLEYLCKIFTYRNKQLRKIEDMSFNDVLQDREKLTPKYTQTVL